MNEKKFLQQVYGKLENQLEQEVKLADDSIEISEGDKVIFRVDSKGDMLYSADKQYSNIVNKLHGKIENDVRNIKEFLKVMDIIVNIRRLSCLQVTYFWMTPTILYPRQFAKVLCLRNTETKSDLPEV